MSTSNLLAAIQVIFPAADGICGMQQSHAHTTLPGQRIACPVLQQSCVTAVKVSAWICKCSFVMQSAVTLLGCMHDGVQMTESVEKVPDQVCLASGGSHIIPGIGMCLKNPTCIFVRSFSLLFLLCIFEALHQHQCLSGGLDIGIKVCQW